jgi:hypothetical protein
MDQADLLPGRAYARGRLLLEAVQDINRSLKAHRIDGPERIATMLFDQLEDPRTFTLPRLGGRWRTTVLDDLKAYPKSSTTSLGNASRSFFDEPTQWRDFSVAVGGRAMPHYTVLGMPGSRSPADRSLRIHWRLVPELH